MSFLSIYSPCGDVRVQCLLGELPRPLKVATCWESRDSIFLAPYLPSAARRRCPKLTSSARLPRGSTLSRTVLEAVAYTEGRGFAMSGAISQLIGHLWGEIVKHGPTVRPFASANAEGLSTPTRHPSFQRRPLSFRLPPFPTPSLRRFAWDA